MVNNNTWSALVIWRHLHGSCLFGGLTYSHGTHQPNFMMNVAENNDNLVPKTKDELNEYLEDSDQPNVDAADVFALWKVEKKKWLNLANFEW